MRLRPFVPALALILLVAGAGCRRAAPALTDPSEIATRMLEQARQDVGDVRDFTVAAEDAVVYYRRSAEATDSLPTFEYRALSAADSMRAAEVPSLMRAVELALTLQSQSSLVGTDTVGGRQAYVLDVGRPDPLFAPPGAPVPPGLAVRAFVDAETFRLAALRVQFDAPDTSATMPIVQTYRYADYRTADGLTLPHRVTSRFEGLHQLFSEEERMIYGGNLGLERSQTAQLPPSAERERRLRELDRQLRFLQPEPFEDTFVVQEVRVGAGVPDRLFAPPTVETGPPPSAP